MPPTRTRHQDPPPSSRLDNGTEARFDSQRARLSSYCSAVRNDGIVAADKTIKLSPSTSVLKHQVGDEIKLSEQDFVQVSQALFAEIERKFV
jgi:hypothetical protein